MRALLLSCMRALAHARSLSLSLSLTFPLTLRSRLCPMVSSPRSTDHTFLSPPATWGSGLGGRRAQGCLGIRTKLRVTVFYRCLRVGVMGLKARSWGQVDPTKGNICPGNCRLRELSVPKSLHGLTRVCTRALSFFLSFSLTHTHAHLHDIFCTPSLPSLPEMVAP